jgi:FMN phosphatase YigB (HAD superfamily)
VDDNRARRRAGRIRAVFFDLGETLLDESAKYTAWADACGVPRHAFLAVLGGFAARGRDEAEVAAYFRPADPPPAPPVVGTPYPDAAPCLAALRDRGLIVGLAAAGAGARAEAGPLAAAADLVTAGVAGTPEFFAAMVVASGCLPEEILYVGDRLDVDVRPAVAAGLVAALVRRGPYGHVHASGPGAAAADFRLDGLAALVDVLDTHNAPGFGPVRLADRSWRAPG